LSNIIKRNYIFYNSSDQHVIDSDSRLNNFAPLTFARVEDHTPEDIEEENEPDSVSTEMVHEISEIEAKAALEKVIAEAETQANEIIENAEQMARKLQDDAISEGKEIGFRQGIEEAQSELEQKKLELEQERRRQEQAYERKMKELEPMFAELTMQLVQKITGVMVEDKKDLVFYLVSEALKPIRGPKNFTIRVSKDDAPLINSKKSELQELLAMDTTLEIFEDPSLQKNQCFIETEDRLLDVSLDVQLANLAEHLRILSCS